MFRTTRRGSDAAPSGSNYPRAVNDDGARDDVGTVPVDGKGGSYRTLQRFFATALPWTEMLVQFFRTHLYQREHEFLLAGDATTVTKAGAQTHGIGRFFRV